MKQFLAARPWWANALLAFCAYMTVIYLPFDLFFKPVSDDQEVWFGILFSGWAAKWLAIPHWFVYAWGAYGFYHMKKWMWPWAGVYAAQVVIAMVVWNFVNVRGGGLNAAIMSGLIFTVPMVALLRARNTFQPAVGQTE